MDREVPFGSLPRNRRGATQQFTACDIRGRLVEGRMCALQRRRCERFFYVSVCVSMASDNKEDASDWNQPGTNGWHDAQLNTRFSCILVEGF